LDLASGGTIVMCLIIILCLCIFYKKFTGSRKVGHV
jgi:zinc transport system permease protein